MMSKENQSTCHPKKVGLFCFRCGRDDFGINQKSLSAHVRYCAPSKRKSSNQPVGPSHSSGTSPYPFLTKRSCTHTEYTLELADTYFNGRNHSDANLHSDEEVFDVGCADSDADGSDNVVVSIT
jgi:hypothetical protein